MHQAELSLREEKRALRRAMAEQRDALSAAQREELVTQATARFLSLPEVRGASVLAGFISTRSEVDTAPLLGELGRRGVDVVLPRVSTGLIPPRLRFHRVAQPSDLVFGIFGLLEPSSQCQEVSAHAIDVFMVPGLAFDRRGARVGYGGGYYDELAAYVRAHPDATAARFIGFAYDFQLVDVCPAGEWDVPLDCVVTDDRVVHCGKAND
ncbi:MAG: 5-formyltetrahydrofolate cyclo-ligase [Polyangia bacterium]|jgi:5-formyltetrahydrofolate cyclo-ligase